MRAVPPLLTRNCLRDTAKQCCRSVQADKIVTDRATGFVYLFDQIRELFPKGSDPREAL